MADNSMEKARVEQIFTALAHEFDRQAVNAHPDLSAGIDVMALARAVDAALAASPPGPVDEGLTPDELNAANDE